MWLEGHQELARHPKTKRLSRLLNISLPTTVGHLFLFWWWAMDYAEDGSLGRYEAADISDAAMWDGEPDTFVSGLLTAGFVDELDDGLHIHDWQDYAGKLLDRKKTQCEYKKRQIALYNDLRLTKAVKERDGDTCVYCGKTVNWNDRRGADGGTYDHVDPDGPNTLENIVVCCRSCNAKKSNRTPEKAGMGLNTGRSMQINGRLMQINGKTPVEKSAITVQYNTVQDNTIQEIPPIVPQKGNVDGVNDEKSNIINERFEKFWAAYPKKVGKKYALKSFERAKPTAELFDKMLKAIEAAKTSPQWTKDNGQYIPQPSTWLNQGRWDDEPTVTRNSVNKDYSSEDDFLAYAYGKGDKT